MGIITAWLERPLKHTHQNVYVSYQLRMRLQKCGGFDDLRCLAG